MGTGAPRRGIQPAGDPGTYASKLAAGTMLSGDSWVAAGLAEPRHCQQLSQCSPQLRGDGDGGCYGLVFGRGGLDEAPACAAFGNALGVRSSSRGAPKAALPRRRASAGPRCPCCDFAQTL